MLKYLFGPLSVNYCVFFYLLSITGIILIICLFLLLSIYPRLLKNIYPILFLILFFGMVYFQNKILYNMCSKEGITQLVNQDTVNNTKNLSSAWNAQYSNVLNFSDQIQHKLYTIYKNTIPLEYVQKSNIVNM